VSVFFVLEVLPRRVCNFKRLVYHCMTPHISVFFVLEVSTQFWAFFVRRRLTLRLRDGWRGRRRSSSERRTRCRRWLSGRTGGGSGCSDWFRGTRAVWWAGVEAVVASIDRLRPRRHSAAGTAAVAARCYDNAKNNNKPSGSKATKQNKQSKHGHSHPPSQYFK